MLTNRNIRQRLLLIVTTCILLGTANIALAQSGQAAQALSDPRYVVRAVGFSPDGQTLAIVSGSSDYMQRDGQIDLWNVGTGQLQQVIKGFDGPVWSVSFSPDGQTLVTGSTEVRDTKLQGGARDVQFFTKIKWWDTKTGELRFEQAKSTYNFRSILAVHSPDGEYLAALEFYQKTFLPYGSGVIVNSSPGETLGPFGPNALPPMRGMAHLARREVMDLKLLNAQKGEVKLDLKSITQSQSFPFRSVEPGVAFFQSPVFLNGGGMFSPNGDLLAIGTFEEIRLLNTQTGKAQLKLKKFEGRARAMAFSPDGSVIAVGIANVQQRSKNKPVVSFSSQIRFYDVHTGQMIKALKVDGEVITYLAFTHGGKSLLIGSRAGEGTATLGRLQDLDLATGKTSVIVNRPVPVSSFLLSPDDKTAAFINGRSTVTLLDLQTGRAKRTFDLVSDDEAARVTNNKLVLDLSRVLAVAFSPDGNTLVAGTEKNEVKLWDPRTGAVKENLTGHHGPVLSVAISPEGKTLASGSDDRTVRLWDAETGRQKNVLTHGTHPVVSVALSPDEQILASCNGNEVLLWDVKTGALKRTLAHMARVNAVAFSSDGRLMASASDDNKVQLWDVRTGEIQKSLVAEGKMKAVSIAPGARVLASASDDGSISVWDIQTGALIQLLKQHSAQINALAFSSDGKLLASGGDDRRVIIWEASSWKSKQKMSGLDLTVTSLAFSPNGKLLASGSGNASVVLWDVQTGKLNRILK